MRGELRRNIGIVSILAVIALSSIFLLWRLGDEPLQDYDEATYAQVVHEALADGNFISFTYGGADYFKKPPLMFWLMGASESVLGETPFAMRLPFALSGIALISVLIALAYEASGDLLVAALAGAIALTTGPLMETARQVRMDVPVTFCIVAAVYFFLRGLRDKRWFLVFGLFAGLAVLIKSVIASFAFLAAFFILLFLRRFSVLKEKYFWYGIGVSLLVALPWHSAETVRYGWAFWQQYIGVEVLDRTQQNLFWTVTVTNSDLWNYIQQFFEPWLTVFFFCLAYVALRWKFLEERTHAVILASSATLFSMLAVFLIAVTKAPTYLIPLYPFAALIIALACSPALISKRHHTATTALVVAVALLLWGGVLTVYNAYHYNPYYSIQLSMAVDEKAIGEQLKTLPEGQQWYVYSDENLGSIMFYSQRLSSIELLPGAHILPGNVIVVDSNATTKLSAAFPNLKTMTLYKGSQVTLLSVL